jgi:hypothetical protein
MSPRSGRGIALTRFFAFVALTFVALAIGCGPPREEPRKGVVPIVRVWDVAVGNLMRSPSLYQSPDQRYVYRVRVVLPAGTYSVAFRSIVFRYPTIVSEPPSIVFECESPPDNNSRAIVVVGTVAEVQRDGIRRSAGVDWQVRVSDCTVHSPPPIQFQQP